MERKRAMVLMIGDSPSSYSFLERRLLASGCYCQFAKSLGEAEAMLEARPFDVVLGPMKLSGNSLHRLSGQLEGSRASAFYSCRVEDGCWWVPAVRFGRSCFGTCALRPSEFVRELDNTIEKIREGGATR
ncbi:MAG TPA: hypothetical protein VMV61_04395 [Patescibacteria group bacterium]|nr:hypothetical protein [Patescibacteria group bacterium]